MNSVYWDLCQEVHSVTQDALLFHLPMKQPGLYGSADSKDISCPEGVGEKGGVPQTSLGRRIVLA